MDKNLELALKKMNEALQHLDDYKVETYNDDFDQSAVDLEEAIEPLSELWQQIHFHE